MIRRRERPPDRATHAGVPYPRLEQDELVRPGREPARAPKRVELGEDRDERVVRRLRCEVFELVSRDVCERLTSARELMMGAA
jgi:hypothetical protein